MLPDPVPIWMCDDTERWHQVAAGTLRRLPGLRLRSFMSGQALLLGLEETRGTPESPWILLMDFFLRGERGDQLTRMVRAVPLSHHLTIVAHSSVPAGSRAIMDAGADVTVRKHETADDDNRDLYEYLRSWLTDHGRQV